MSTVDEVFFYRNSQLSTVSSSSIEKNNIRRILTIEQTHEHEGPGLFTALSQAGRPIDFKTIVIDDDALVDILQHLEAVCDWIQVGLQSKSDGHDRQSQAGVLLQSRQDNSRSGAFVVAYSTYKTFGYGQVSVSQ